MRTLQCKKKYFLIFCLWKIENTTQKSCSESAQTPFSHSPKLIFHIKKLRDQTSVLLSVGKYSKTLSKLCMSENCSSEIRRSQGPIVNWIRLGLGVAANLQWMTFLLSYYFLGCMHSFLSFGIPGCAFLLCYVRSVCLFANPKDNNENRLLLQDDSE